jgi:hypothetical protein
VLLLMVSARKQGPSSALHVGPKIESRRRRPSAEILWRYFAFARDVAPRNISSRIFPPKAGCLLSNPRARQVTRLSLVSGFSLIVLPVRNASKRKLRYPSLALTAAAARLSSLSRLFRLAPLLLLPSRTSVL